MSEEISTSFEKKGEKLIKDEYKQEEFVRSRSPSPRLNNFDRLSYSEDEYNSDDVNDADYIPCNYHFCDEPYEYKCDECEVDLCIDHTYVKYDEEYFCTFCLTNRFDRRLDNAKKSIKNIKGLVKNINRWSDRITTDICALYLFFSAGVVALIGYSIQNGYKEMCLY